MFRCCVSPAKKNEPVVSPDNVSKFKVTSKTPGVLSGVLEINDDELVHYQVKSDAIKWPFGCLRRHSGGAGTFLFVSGQRCSTGAGLYLFKCEKVDILYEVFTDKLKKFHESLGRHKSSDNHSPANLSTSPQSRHPDVEAYDLTPTQVVDEPYLIPLSLPKPLARKSRTPKPLPRQSIKGYVNGLMLNEGSQQYVNFSPLPPTTKPYVNILSNTQGNAPSEGSTSSGYVEGKVRQPNYLVREKSCAIPDPNVSSTMSSSVNGSDEDGSLSPLPPSGNRDLLTNHGGAVSFDYMVMKRSDNGNAGSAPHTTGYMVMDVTKTSALSSVLDQVLSDSSQE